MTRTEREEDGIYLRLPFMILARICTTAVFMTYPACLNVLLAEWQMSATEGGLVQGAFTGAFAISLLLVSFLCDRYGARRVFNLATLASALAALAMAVFARSFETALITMMLVGVTQGGTYTPAIMLVSVNAPAHRKNAAVGWVLAGMSAGYILSIALSSSLVAKQGYEAAFLVTAVLPVLGWIFGLFSIRRAKDTLQSSVADHQPFTSDMRKRSRLLTIGYIGHTWELLGMWAWVPAFLAAAAVGSDTFSAVELGLWTALALHLSGFISSFMSGYAADRFGARTVLITFAALGFMCSAVIGWLPSSSVVALLLVVALYGFATIGDSAVLSSAMTDAVPAQHLGKALGLRSILGTGAGAVAPVTFGIALDSMPEDLGWGIAFSTLAVGGFLATVCAILLKR
ncbi:MAG: MFS transporter [Sneathiellales bacterium]|nr:MFS transporter [Sneathiellales bacterium]